MSLTTYQRLQSQLREEPKTWLITGVGGFIGANLLETLLRLNQTVVGLDNFSTGSRENLEEVLANFQAEQRKRFHLIEGDIRDLATCQSACHGVDYVLHQAALGSIPRSIQDPITSNACNVTGFLNLLVAVRDQRARRLVYASSSSVYGDAPELPKVEDRIGRQISPYAVTKFVNELYAAVFGRVYRVESIGLRYFNVFGPRQDPNGHYAAVIPQWVAAMIQNRPARINGDGSHSRDFCFVANAVQANLLAATTAHPEACNQVFNVALNSRTNLNELFALIRRALLPHFPHLTDYSPVYQEPRPGDISHSRADISKAQRLLGYEPTHTVDQGLALTLDWYKTRGFEN